MKPCFSNKTYCFLAIEKYMRLARKKAKSTRTKRLDEDELNQTVMVSSLVVCMATPVSMVPI